MRACVRASSGCARNVELTSFSDRLRPSFVFFFKVGGVFFLLLDLLIATFFFSVDVVDVVVVVVWFLVGVFFCFLFPFFGARFSGPFDRTVQ